MNYKLLFKKSSPTNKHGVKSCNTRLKILNRKQELTTIEFGLLKCQTVTPVLRLSTGAYEIIHTKMTVYLMEIHQPVEDCFLVSASAH